MHFLGKRTARWGFNLPRASTGNVIEVIVGICVCYVHDVVTFHEGRKHSDPYRKIFKKLRRPLRI